MYIFVGTEICVAQNFLKSLCQNNNPLARRGNSQLNHNSPVCYRVSGFPIRDVFLFSVVPPYGRRIRNALLIVLLQHGHGAARLFSERVRIHWRRQATHVHVWPQGVTITTGGRTKDTNSTDRRLSYIFVNSSIILSLFPASSATLLFPSSTSSSFTSNPTIGRTASRRRP